MINPIKYIRVKLLQKYFYNRRVKKVIKDIIQKLPIPLGLKLLLKNHFLCWLLNIKRYRYTEPLLTDEIISEIDSLPNKPLISIIIPTYNSPVKYLDLAIKSVERQWYKNWELCIADDGSANKKTLEYLKGILHPNVKIKFLPKNVNISMASNEAFSIASGPYIALMDHDDELTPDALYEVVKVINSHKAEFVYTDEDLIETGGKIREAHFKSDFSPDMLFSYNFICHLAVIKRELIEAVGGFTPGLEGAQDYDLFLKIQEQTNKIYHIPKVLYHWRKISGSTALNISHKPYAIEAGKKALESAIARRNIKASVVPEKNTTYRVKYDIDGNPLVSIIIPFKDKPELIRMCINSILEKSTYRNYEIIGISNNSTESNTFDCMDELSRKDASIHFYEINISFNYSMINNIAVREHVKGRHIILLNNDIEIITPSWIEAMLEFSQRTDVGAVGAKLYFPDNFIQHAGVIIGIGGFAGHHSQYFSREMPGYYSRNQIVQNLSAVTAACMMIKRDIYLELNGFDKDNLGTALNDIDFCLRLREKGYLNVFTPFCEAYHHESSTRGYEDTPEKQERFQKEIAYFKKRHQDILKNGDPYYNQNLSLERGDFSTR